jgi:anti-sigma factor RsiW
MRAEPHVLTGAYAAHALSDVERAAFQRHLETCPACAREVRELRATLARLGSATATAPPAGLWDRVRVEAAGWRRHRPDGPTCCGWSTGAARGRPGWSRPVAGGG